MRILHVSSEHPPQQIFGLGRYVCDLSRELARQGHAVHVLTNSIGGKDQDVCDHGVEVHRVAFPPPPKPPGSITPVMAFNLHLQQRASELGREGLGNPDVLVSHDWLTALAGQRIAERWKLPHVWTVHDTVYGKRFGKVETAEDRMVQDLERWAVQASNLVLANSRAIRSELRDAYQGKGDRIRLLHCGIDPSLWTSAQSPARIKQFRTVFATPDEVLLTYTGRLDLEKGIDTLINAFALLQARYPKTRLAIVGQGSLEQTIREHIRSLRLDSAITLYGYLKGEPLKHFYLVSDIHVCPSHYEPFGLVAVEAMASRTAVVASSTGGLADIISKPAVGRLFPTRDVKALAEVLIELVGNRDLRDRLAENAYRHARSQFAWSRISKVAVKWYQEAIASRN